MKSDASNIRGLGVRIVVRILSLGLTLCVASAVHAQDLQVTLNGTGWATGGGWNYGNVAVGTSATATFDLLSGWPSPLWVYTVCLNETPDFVEPYAWPADPFTPSYSLGAFSLGLVTDPETWNYHPNEVPVGEHRIFDVIFTPPAPGDYSVYLGVHSNDSILPPGPQLYLLLEGTGVSAVVPAPGALLLAVVGAGIVALKKRRARR